MVLSRVNHHSRIWVAGEHGMVGSAIVRALRASEHTAIISSRRRVPDLTNAAQTMEFVEARQPEVIIVAAGRVGGIEANARQPVEFLTDNILIAKNVIEAAHAHKVEKLLYLGSSCIYPRLAPQPMKPEHLLSGPLEPSNEGYALAKIAGIKLCQYYRRQYGCNFITAMPCNLYGPGDTYRLGHSHVIPELLMKFNDAVKGNLRKVECLGDGKPQREFLFVDDLATACLILLRRYNGEEVVNVGSGSTVTIRTLAGLIAQVTGFSRTVKWSGKSNGMPKKLMDSTPMREMGWSPKVTLRVGLKLAQDDYLRRMTPTPYEL